MEYAKERMDDLLTTYDRCIERAKFIRMNDIYAEVAKMPAKRFWVSDIRASLVVSALIRGENPLKTMWKNKKEMYTEIYRRVKELAKSRPKLSVLELCSIVVMQPAPSFYLTPGSTKVMICKARKEWVKRKMQRLLKR